MVLKILISNNLTPVRHGFFTRQGGVSRGIFRGLNCGLSSSDQTEAVITNRILVEKEIQAKICTVDQIHSSNVVTITASTTTPRQADAMVTKTKGLALAILSADCAPILCVDSRAGVIGAAHAGWKGALAGIIENNIAAMINLGANHNDISATVGPCISQKNYQVNGNFLQNFINVKLKYSHFFIDDNNGKYLFDLPSFCLFCLKNAGISQAVWNGYCTYQNADEFYSYRRAIHQGEPDYGRQISTIILD